MKKLSKRCISVLLISLFVISVMSSAVLSADYVKGRILVLFKAGTSVETMEKIISENAVGYEMLDDGKAHIENELPDYKLKRLDKIKDRNDNILVYVDIFPYETEDEAIEVFKKIDCVVSAGKDEYLYADDGNDNHLGRGIYRYRIGDYLVEFYKGLYIDPYGESAQVVVPTPDPNAGTNEVKILRYYGKDTVVNIPDVFKLDDVWGAQKVVKVNMRRNKSEIKKMFIPNGIEIINLQYAAKLHKIELSQDNQWYKVKDGKYLISKNGKKLLCVTGATKKVVVPKGVTKIEGISCKAKTVELNSKVKNIRSKAFSACNNLKRLIIKNKKCKLVKGHPINFAKLNNVTIVAPKNSLAQKFAKKNSISFKELK